jgi:hypothetical protein
MEYYGFILSSMYLKVKTLKYCIIEKNDSKINKNMAYKTLHSEIQKILMENPKCKM